MRKERYRRESINASFSCAGLNFQVSDPALPRRTRSSAIILSLVVRKNALDGESARMNQQIIPWTVKGLRVSVSFFEHLAAQTPAY